jgi:putative phosphoesterase
MDYYTIVKILLKYRMHSKKLLVFSDTHGSTGSLKAVFSWANNYTPPNGTICAAFLGDGIADLQPAAKAAGFFCEWKLVKGNNDFEYSLPEAAVMEFAGNCFLLSHGHRHSLYGGYHSLAAAARNVNANAVLFGHTHIPTVRTADSILLINPGSVGRPRSKIGATFAVIECKEGEPPEAAFYGIEHGKIKEIKLH